MHRYHFLNSHYSDTTSWTPILQQTLITKIRPLQLSLLRPPQLSLHGPPQLSIIKNSHYSYTISSTLTTQILLLNHHSSIYSHYADSTGRSLGNTPLRLLKRIILITTTCLLSKGPMLLLLMLTLLTVMVVVDIGVVNVTTTVVPPVPCKPPLPGLFFFFATSFLGGTSLSGRRTGGGTSVAAVAEDLDQLVGEIVFPLWQLGETVHRLHISLQSDKSERLHAVQLLRSRVKTVTLWIQKCIIILGFRCNIEKWVHSGR